MGLRVIGGRNTRVIFRTHANSNTNQNTFTSTGVPFGEESPRRWIIVSFRCTNLTANLSAPSSCTIGGVPASLVRQFPTGTSLSHYQIWIAQVPTGTTGNISISRAANMTGQVLCVWTAYDLTSGVQTDSNVSSFANPASLDLVIASGGIAVAYTDGASAGAYSWSNLVEDVDSNLGTIHYSAASESKLPGGTRSISVSGAANHQIIAASFR